MKKFKNSFGVKGPFSLIKAFKEEAEKLGWKYDNEFSDFTTSKYQDLFFTSDHLGRSPDPLQVLQSDRRNFMKPQHFSLSTVKNCTSYHLPEQWSEALEAAGEVETPSNYVRLLVDKEGFERGDVAEVVESDCNNYFVNVEYRHSIFLRYAPYVRYSKPHTTPITAEEYHEEVNLQKLIEEAKKKYPLGTVVRSLGGNEEATITKTNFTLRGKTPNFIQNHGDCLVYVNGRWAKILKPSPLLEIAGHPVKIEGNKIDIGCYTNIRLDDLKALRHAIGIADKFNTAYNVETLGIKDSFTGNTISVDEIDILIKTLQKP